MSEKIPVNEGCGNLSSGVELDAHVFHKNRVCSFVNIIAMQFEHLIQNSIDLVAFVCRKGWLSGGNNENAFRGIIRVEQKTTIGHARKP
ncbi:MAG TPA: hypothetical protein VKA08_18055 [Balneolales bacterium]|nr:hypothetical protein [Balneolales bacterium]